MKTIDEAAKEFAKNQAILQHSFVDEVAKRTAEHACYKASLQMAEFTQRWIPIEEELPMCYQSGDWDGLKSDVVICKDKNWNVDLAHCYEVFLDGTKFYEWYDVDDFELQIEVTHFRPINYK
jgi:hypothetical protein